MKDRLRKLVPGACLVALMVALYLPSLANPLVWDDEILVDLAHSASPREAFEHQAGRYRRPLTLLSYMIQDDLGGGARSLHAFNIGIHALNVLLLYLLLVRLGVGRSVALAGSAIFGVHPLQSAAVAYVSGRTDLLAALFSLASFHAVLVTRDGGSRAGIHALGAGMCVFAASLSKEIGLLAGPLAVALWYVRRPERTLRGAWVPIAVGIATLAAAALVLPAAVLETGSVDWATRLRGAGTALATYARLLVLPSNLHLDRLTAVGGSVAIPLGLAVVAGLVGTLVVFFIRPSLVRFAGLAAALLYFPASGLVPVYPAIATRWVFTPEHFLYLPLGTLAPLAALAVASSVERGIARYARGISHAASAAALGVAALVVALSIGPVLARQAQLADAETVYRTTLAHSPSPRACFNLGVTLIGKASYDEAVSVYERCAKLSPSDAGVYVQLGVAHQYAGRPGEAEQAYATAVRMNPADPLAWSNYASLDASSGRFDRARQKWLEALKLDPGFEPAQTGLRRLEGIERLRGSQKD
jgi:hypothetical protein